MFEPYLKTYSQSEERKITNLLDGVVGPNDKIEALDFKIYLSSQKMFKNIRDSMRRCISFSNTKALFDLQTSFKNVFKYYRTLLKRQIPTRSYDLSYETLKFGLPNSNDTLKALPEKPMSDDVEMKCVYIINTCEFCLDVIPQLE